MIEARNDKDELAKVLTPVELEKFYRNKTLLDLTLTPVDLQREIITVYNKKEIKGTMIKLMGYFSQNKMTQLSEMVSDF